MSNSKRIIAAALILVLLLALMPAAGADIYPAPTPVQAGSALEHKIATVNAGETVSAMAETLPLGVDLYTEPCMDGIDLFLRGVPLYAGNYNCILNVGDTSLSCPLTVEPAYPVILSASSDVLCSVNDPVRLEVSAYAQDSGMLSYQWYLGQLGSGALIGDNSPSLSVGTSMPGTSYYYCVVTNTNNGYSVSSVSPVIAVTVQDAAVVNWIALFTEPYKTVYSVGEMLDTAGLQLSVGYSDGSSEVISSGFYVDNVQLSGPGVQTVNVYYEGFSCSFNVTVGEQAEIITGIGVLTPPNKIRYTVGEMLDTTGLSIRAYNNSSLGYRDIGPEFLTCSPTQLNVPGQQDILVVYGDKSCTFPVTVEEPEHPVSLMVQTMPNRVSYTVGETLDITGLVLHQISSRQNSQLIYSGFSCTPTQLNTPGRTQITVYYDNLSTSFTVSVSSSAPIPTASPGVVPGTIPTGAPTPIPSSAPTGAPTPIPSSPPPVIPSASPSLTPTMTPRTPARSGHQSNLGRSLIGVIVITALVALAVLGAYVFVMNQGGLEGAEARLRELLNKGKNKKDDNRRGKH